MLCCVVIVCDYIPVQEIHQACIATWYYTAIVLHCDCIYSLHDSGGPGAVGFIAAAVFVTLVSGFVLNFVYYCTWRKKKEIDFTCCVSSVTVTDPLNSFPKCTNVWLFCLLHLVTHEQPMTR